MGKGIGSRGLKRVWGVCFGSPPSSVSEGKGCTLSRDSREGTICRGGERVWGVWFGSPPSSVSEGKGCTLGNSMAGF